ncbi:four helix bundle protein [Carboxylicivirga linearis]|uniref:Four helix bundle protein n=1 Tax=Carboxylicivirga linearis TaxID=1628157 RepID=A0ABS5JQT0_9BACT|nr:four helix bundle protein [Carboxylicivirga linearis]MBS2097163.1 four helix bundle protein [Carboxylicivirga linearis]
MKNYKQLKIWQKGIEIVKATYDLTAQLPDIEKFNLVSQMNRCSVSIPSNIAEGSSRRSDKDYHRYVEIALGSCFELDTQLEIVKLQYSHLEEFVKILENLIEEEAKMLQSFMKKLK